MHTQGGVPNTTGARWASTKRIASELTAAKAREAGREAAREVRGPEAGLPIFCTMCGAEMDTEYSLTARERGTLRRCDACKAADRKSGAVKYCGTCGGQYTHQEFVEANPGRDAWSLRIAWGGWRTHDVCQGALKEAARVRAALRSQTAGEARDRALRALVRAIEHPELREAVARRLKTTLD